MIIFIKNQISAAIFGIFLLVLMIATKYYYPLSNLLHRYDFLLIMAILFQMCLILFKLERKNEIFAIFIFHILATIMELFKTSDAISAWHYPEDYILGINNVPLFAGFMYSAVGSYIARIWRIYNFEPINFPKLEYAIIVSILIYVNFFSHHYLYDIRWFLLLATVVLFGKTYIQYNQNHIYKKIYLLPVWLLVAIMIWIAENIATYTHVWLYPNQIEAWHIVSYQKIISWYLLMTLSFVLISLIRYTKNSSIAENYLKFGFILYATFILVIIINLNLKIINHQNLAFIKYIPGGDYTVRILTFFLFTIMLNLFLRLRQIKIRHANLYVATIFAVVFATTEELSQLWIKNRFFDLFDILYSYAGILIASIVTRLTVKNLSLNHSQNRHD